MNAAGLVEHRCNPHTLARPWQRTHVCPLCRREWRRESRTMWSYDATETPPSEIVAVTVRHADGTTETHPWADLRAPAPAQAQRENQQ